MKPVDHDLTELGSIELFSGRVLRFEHSVRRADGKSSFRIVSIRRHEGEPRDMVVTIPHGLVAELYEAIDLFEERASAVLRDRQQDQDRSRRQAAQDFRHALRRRGR